MTGKPSTLGVFLFALVPLFVPAAVAGMGAPSATPQGDENTAAAGARPNILFLFADDLRPDAIGAYGNESIETPAIDRLVARGFSFRRNYCMGSIHGAVCQPSRAMLLSGRTLWRVPMDLEGVKTLPQCLAERGYVTFGTGKWHNGRSSFLEGFEKGRAVFFGGMSDHTRVPVQDIVEEGKLGKRRISDAFSSELFADAVIDFLRSDREGRPFFAYVSFTAPHDPRQPPGKYREMYYERRPPLPRNFKPQHPFHNGWMTGRDEKLAPWPRTPGVIRDQLAEYYGMVTHLDAQVGRILEVLEETGESRNTVVIFTADHGLAVGSHGLLGKQNLYEHSMGCPLVLAGPGIPAGRSSEALTYLHDLFPTLASITGAPLPEGVEGKSLTPILAGRTTSVRETLFTAYEDLMRAVRDDRWKLIRYPKIDHHQLFDLENDPHELVNLASDPSHAARVDRMMELLREWQERTGDPHPLRVKDPRPMEVDLSGRERRPDRHQPEWIRRKYFGDSKEEKAEKAEKAGAAGASVKKEAQRSTREGWPEFRGPEQDGSSDALGLPLRWSETENVRWKTRIHGKGWSTPVVLGEQVWLTTATEDGKDMFVVTVDRRTGEVIRDISLFHNESPRPLGNDLNSYASPSPVIEPGRVWVHFGSYGTACLDTETGSPLWKRRDLPCNHFRGPASSPVLFDGLLIFHMDGSDHQYVVALDKETGETVWKTDRSTDYGDLDASGKPRADGDFRKAFNTPLIARHDGEPLMISPAAKAAYGCDPRTGRELWQVRHGGHSSASRSLFLDGVAFINTGYSRAELWAVRVGGSGDVTETHVVWKRKRSIPKRSSPVLVGGHLYSVDDKGVGLCLDAKTGEEVWSARIGGNYSASPVHVDGRIYFSSHGGKTTVIAPGREYRVLATNELDDGFMASPAIAGKAFYLRARTHLYRIEDGTTAP